MNGNIGNIQNFRLNLHGLEPEQFSKYIETAVHVANEMKVPFVPTRFELELRPIRPNEDITGLDNTRFLILFEAALRNNLPNFAELCLNNWFYMIEKLDQGLLPPVKKIEMLRERILFPNFSKRDETEQMLDKRLGHHILIKELVYRHFHPEEASEVPQHVKAILGYSEHSQNQRYVIAKYAHLM